MKKKDLDIKKFTQKEIYDENKNNVCVKKILNIVY